MAKKYNFGFSDWENRRQNDLPDSIFGKLTPPEIYRAYRPDWGKASERGERASTTRNANRHKRNKELFTREVLPLIVGKMGKVQKFETALVLQNCELLEESGFRFWFSTEKKAGTWIHRDEKEKESRAVELGAEPVPHSQAFEIINR